MWVLNLTQGSQGRSQAHFFLSATYLCVTRKRTPLSCYKKKEVHSSQGWKHILVFRVFLSLNWWSSYSISFSTSSVVNGPLKDLCLAEFIQTSWVSLSQMFLQHSESLDFCCKAKKVCGLRKNISLTILQSLEFANPPHPSVLSLVLKLKWPSLMFKWCTMTIWKTIEKM